MCFMLLIVLFNCLVFVQQISKQLYLSTLLFSQFEFSPQTLCCYGKQLCTIQRDAAYFSYQNRYVLWEL